MDSGGLCGSCVREHGRSGRGDGAARDGERESSFCEWVAEVAGADEERGDGERDFERRGSVDGVDV